MVGGLHTLPSDYIVVLLIFRNGLGVLGAAALCCRFLFFLP